jgi:hypothetical protein
MAVRVPLYLSGTDLQEMSSIQVNQLVDQIVYQYSTDPTVVLSVVGSSGNLDAIDDTRLQAGAQSTSASGFPSEATTAEPSTVTVSYDKLTSTTTNVSPTADTGKTWPIYYTAGGDIRPMSLDDVKDTFLHPAIDLLSAATSTSQQAGTYTIHTATTLAGATEVSGANTPIFTDTRADTAAYTAGAIPETLDQPTTITNYYLFRINGSDTSYTPPMFVRGDNDLQVMTDATFEALAKEWIRHTAAQSADGYALSYNIGTSGSGNTRGSGIANTVLTGSGNYQTYQAGADDYRAQEFPDGSTSTAATYYLRINKS